jgi:hypothetical protein
MKTALRELGAPNAIAAGMTGVHTMPRMLKNTLALGLFTAISLTVINSSRAQIEVVGEIFFITTPTEQIKVTGAIGTYFLKYSSIKKNLENAGIIVDDTLRKTRDDKTGAGDVPTLRFRFPGSAQDMLLQASDIIMLNANPITPLDKSGASPNTATNSGATVTTSPSSADMTDQVEAISLLSFTRQLLKRSGLPVRVLGWRNPIIEVGTTKLQIGTEKSSAREIFVDAAGRSVQSGFPQLSAWLGFGGSNKHAVRVSDPPGTVYAVVTPSPSIPSLQTIDAARVADDGVLYFAAPYKTLEFVKTPLELVRDRLSINKRGYGSSRRPAKALLVKITPDLKTSFVLPIKLRSAALK